MEFLENFFQVTFFFISDSNEQKIKAKRNDYQVIYYYYYYFYIIIILIILFMKFLAIKFYSQIKIVKFN